MLGNLQRNHLARVAVTLGLSGLGGFVAEMAGLPAGWIAGGLLAVTVASLAGVNTRFPRALNAPVFLVLGLYAGTGVSEETLQEMRTWPGSFLILGVSIVGVTGGSYWWLHARCAWDRNTALLASAPGALSLVISVAEGVKADMTKVVMSQILRVLLLVETIPLIALLIGHPLGGQEADRAPIAGPRDLALFFAVGTAVSLILHWARLPGAWVLGGLTASASLILTGVVEARLPGPLVIACMIALCALTGSRFRPGDLAILPRIARPSLVAFAIACAVSVASAAATSLLFGINFIQTLLAFAPGALDALTVLAFQMNIDPAYVAAHHVVRYLALVASVPFLGRWISRHP